MCQIIYLNLDPTKNICSYRQLDGGHGSWYPHKECVTTHQPNEHVSKMDGAKGNNLYWIVGEKKQMIILPLVGGLGNYMKKYKDWSFMK